MTDFKTISDLFNVIKSAAEHGTTRFSNIVAAAHAELLKIEAELSKQAQAVKATAASVDPRYTMPPAQPQYDDADAPSSEAASVDRRL